MNYILRKNAMLVVVMGSLAISGSAFAMKKNLADGASIAGAASVRELILQLIATGAKEKGINLTKKVRGVIVFNNEIAVDTAEHATTAALNATSSESGAVKGLIGGVEGWLRSVLIVNGSAQIPASWCNKVRSNMSEKTYGSLVVAAKGVVRFLIQSAIESGKAYYNDPNNTTRTKKTWQNAHISFGITFGPRI